MTYQEGGEHARRTYTVVMKEWDDEDTNNGVWPPPDRHQESLITGQLADKVRRRIGDTVGADVFITETLSVHGWSEYTEEHYWEHTISCGDKMVRFDGVESNGLSCLLAWLDNKNVVGVA